MEPQQGVQKVRVLIGQVVVLKANLGEALLVDR